MGKTTEPALVSLERCFACDRPLTGDRFATVVTSDGQTVFVGHDCFDKIERDTLLGDGYQPPKGGPKLKTLTGKGKMRQNLKRKSHLQFCEEIASNVWGTSREDASIIQHMPETRMVAKVFNMPVNTIVQQVLYVMGKWNSADMRRSSDHRDL